MISVDQMARLYGCRGDELLWSVTGALVIVCCSMNCLEVVCLPVLLLDNDDFEQYY